MNPPRYDIQFSGSLVPGTDPDEARRQIQTLFHLSDQVVAQLFSGQSITIKRGVDEATASRYRDRFRKAGALVRIIPVAQPEINDSPASTERSGTTGEGLTLAPPGAPLDELPRETGTAPDTSHLSIVPGNDWTLEDCAPPPPTAPPPDIRHLALEPRPNGEDRSSRSMPQR